MKTELNPLYQGKIIKIVKRPCYRLVTELTNFSSSKEFPITYAIDLKGDYLGDSRTAYRLVNKYGISVFEKTSPEHCVCSIGYNLHKKLWYGWSHRAIYGFKNKHKAIRFAKSVS